MQRIVLLTSILPPKPRCFLPCSPDYIPNLEDIFYHKFRNSRYELEIIHYADQFHLYSALHHPRNVAVFWLSHATAGSNSKTQNPITKDIFDSHKMIDANGYDVKPVFGKVHPNLKVLAIIGCLSSDVAVKFTRRDDLKTLSFDGKIEPRLGLQKSIDQAQSILNHPSVLAGYPAKCTMGSYYQLNVWRDFRGLFKLQIDPTKITRPAVRVMANGKLLGVFPPPQERESYQFMRVLLPAARRTLPDLRFDAGENAKILTEKSKSSSVTQLVLGCLRPFLENNMAQELWNVWQRDGKPVGICSNTYLLNRSLMEQVVLEPNIMQTTEFTTEAMPPY